MPLARLTTLSSPAPTSHCYPGRPSSAIGAIVAELLLPLVLAFYNHRTRTAPTSFVPSPCTSSPAAINSSLHAREARTHGGGHRFWPEGSRSSGAHHDHLCYVLPRATSTSPHASSSAFWPPFHHRLQPSLASTSACRRHPHVPVLSNAGLLLAPL